MGGPSGPARVAIGVKIKHGKPPGEMPRVELLLQLRGQNGLSATVQCGAGSACRSPYMYDSILFVPVNELLHGSPLLLRLLISLYLAVVTPLTSVVMGGLFALWDVFCGRRRVAEVGSACRRSLRGPWWDVLHQGAGRAVGK